jgi:membrane-bound serine protease (ClpP class)
MHRFHRQNFSRWRRAIIALLVMMLCLSAAIAQEAPVPAAPPPPPAPAAPPPIAPPAIQPGDAAANGKVLLPPQDKAAIIKLYGEVDKMTKQSLERRLDIARKAGCTLVIYEIDTYGGLLQTGLEISELTRKLPTDSRLNTVAWINTKAISDGALIACACQHIVMASDATLGDCAPIRVSNETLVLVPPTERAKLSAPLLLEFDQSAAQNKYNRTLLHAMVDVTIEVHEIEERKTGQIRFVDTQEKDALIAVPPGEHESPWRYVETIDNANQLLTVKPDMAMKMGLAQATVNNEQELRAVLNIRGELITLDFNWAEVATVWLTGFWIRAMLFFAMLVFAYIEFSHPGITVPGVLAIICLVLLVGAPFLTGIAQIWEIVLIVLGLGIIIIDLFVFGGIGLLAVPGFILMAVGLVASFVPFQPGGFHAPATWIAMRNGLMVVVFGSLAALVAFYLLSKYLYITPGFRRLQLAPATGAAGAGNMSLRDAADRAADEAVFVGAVGKAATDLRPAGKARFGDHLIDVVSFGSFIERNSEVEVTEVAGNHIVVKPRHSRPQPTATEGTA